MNDQKFIREVWEMVKNTFRETLSETTVSLWFDEVEILSFKNDSIQLGIPSEMKYNIISAKYLDKIKETFSALLGFPVEVDLRFTGSAVAADRMGAVTPVSPVETPKSTLAESALPSYNFEYTFENFIVGSTNKFAHAACMAVANQIDRYNPLFIYGNSGQIGRAHV